MPDDAFKAVHPSGRRLGASQPVPDGGGGGGGTAYQVWNPKEGQWESSSSSTYIKGWKTQRMVENQGNVTLTYEEFDFYGLGSCPPPAQAISKNDLYSAAGSSDALIPAYMTILRTQCLGKEVELVRSLVDTHVLSISLTLFSIYPESVHL